MDINDLRGLATVFAMAAFIGIAIWAYSSKRKARFDDAAQLPFADDDGFDEEESSKKDASAAEKKEEQS